MKAGYPTTTLTSLGGENMWETQRFERYDCNNSSGLCHIFNSIVILFIWQEELAKFLGPCVSFIEKELAAGSSVLVHCLAGAHRSQLMKFLAAKKQL